MIINKMTCGYVIQKFDTDQGKFISQEFVSGGEVSYEDSRGNPEREVSSYMGFDMVQPKLENEKIRGIGKTHP